MDILGIIISLLLGGLAVIVVARIVPGFRIRGGVGSAILVGAVYGVLKIFLQTILIVVSLPLVILTLGLFILVINAFLLWLTDKLISRFSVSGIGSLLLGALLLSIIDLAMQLVLRHGALF